MYFILKTELSSIHPFSLSEPKLTIVLYTKADYVISKIHKNLIQHYI